MKISKNYFFLVFISSLFSITGCDADQKSYEANTDIRLQNLASIPIFEGRSVAYDPRMRKKYAMVYSYEDWYRTFREKIVYKPPGLKAESMSHNDKRLKEIPSYMLKEDTAYIQGKVVLEDDVQGIIIVEPGYHSITRVFVYPVSRDGMVWKGLELADRQSDENEEIIITSTFEKNNGVNIITSVKTVRYKEGANISAPRIVAESMERKWYWEFNKADGFVQKNRAAEKPQKTGSE